MGCHKGATMHKWTDEEKAYLAEIVQGRSHKEISDMMVSKFGDYFTVDRIKGAINRYKLNTGRTGYFEAGHVPMNKGKTWNEFMSPEAQERSRATTFKPGNLPPNTREVGEERISKDGYVEVHVAQLRTSKANDQWVAKHRLIWEQAHGEIPANHNIVFADGDTSNFDLNNLVCVSRSHMATINHSGLKYSDTDSLKAATLVAQLKHTIKDRECSDRPCKRCGNVFKPRYKSQRTCDECLGRKA